MKEETRDKHRQVVHQLQSLNLLQKLGRKIKLEGMVFEVQGQLEGQDRQDQGFTESTQVQTETGKGDDGHFKLSW